MSAERLREAAALMRSRVAAAPEQTKVAVRVEGPWLNSRHYMPVEGEFLGAVADWLDETAETVRLFGDAENVSEASAVADAYLGATS